MSAAMPGSETESSTGTDSVDPGSGGSLAVAVEAGFVGYLPPKLVIANIYVLSSVARDQP